MSTSNDEIVVGIDLGTTYSCISCYQDGKPIIFDDDLGNKTLASYVSFTDTEFLVGQAAKNLCPINGPNTVYDVKRILGRDFNDPELQRDLKHFPFAVYADETTNQPIIGVTYKGQQRYFKPEQISALVLQKLKNMAEVRLGHPVRKAVITVPAYYGDAQRSATLAAAQIAGLEVVRLLNEPSAAAIAFGLRTQSLELNGTTTEGCRNIAVFDLGGGTFDVSILQLKGSDYTVLATSGDAHLGGEDLDITLTRFVIHTYKQKTGVDLEQDQNAIRRLKRACEDAKIALSTSLKTTISLDNISQGQDLEMELSRARFEQLCGKYFQQCLPPLTKALESANLTKAQIDDVVLIGGSTRIPAIQKIVSDYFDGKALSKSINPDEAVSIGAAIQAATLSTHKSQAMTNNILISDVTPLDLGIALVNDELSIILPHNTAIPTTMKQRYVTSLDGQTDMIIDILEGNNPKASGNNRLGTVMLSDIPPHPAGAVSADIGFSFDANGVLSCSAQIVDSNTGYVISQASISFPKRAQIAPETMMILQQDNLEISREQDEANKKRLRELQDQLGSREAALEEFRRAVERICKMIQDAGPEVLSNSQRAAALLMKVLQLLQQIARGDFNLNIEEMKELEKEINKEVDELIRELKRRQREKGLVPEHVASQAGYFD